MPKKGKLDRVDKETKQIIADLRGAGRTLDEIHAKLRELGVNVARSTAGRYIANLDKIGEKLRETRAIADALVANFGDRSDNKMLQLNIELMMPGIMKMLTAEGDEGVELDAQERFFLAKALGELSKAQSLDTARLLKMRTEFAKEAAKNVEAVAKAQGLTRDTVTMIKAAILGVDAPAPKETPAAP